MPEAPRKKVVLVVEDHPLNMRLATDLLTLNGFEVVPAPDGESALQTLEQIEPDVILLDLHLPGMDGYQVLRSIRQDARLARVPIVALTASAMREEAEQIFAAGFTDYIAKPIDIKQFIHRIRTITTGSGDSRSAPS